MSSRARQMIPLMVGGSEGIRVDYLLMFLICFRVHSQATEIHGEQPIAALYHSIEELHRFN